MVEQLPVKELVPGSSPGRGAKFEKSPVGDFFVLLFSGRTRRPEKISWEDVFEAGSRVAQRTCEFKKRKVRATLAPLPPSGYSAGGVTSVAETRPITRTLLIIKINSSNPETELTTHTTLRAGLLPPRFITLGIVA